MVPWDFSDHARDALNEALDLVDDPKQIRVVHIAYLPIMVGPGMLGESINEDAVIQSSEARFRESVLDDPRFKELSYTTLAKDEQGRAICDFARHAKADLIVISTHGRTGFSRIAMGSVAERVVRYATCPVLVLRSEAK